MATTTTTAAEENPGRIYIKDLPEDHSDYDAWRYTLCAQVLRAAPDPVQAMHYLRELGLSLSLRFACRKGREPTRNVRNFKQSVK